MSLIGKRQEIADALNEATDVQGYRYRPSVVAEGDAWSILIGLERDEDSNQFMATWQIRICVPQDEDAANQWVDEHYEEIFEALEPVAYIGEMAPLRLPVTVAGTTVDMNVLAITVRSE